MSTEKVGTWQIVVTHGFWIVDDMPSLNAIFSVDFLIWFLIMCTQGDPECDYCRITQYDVEEAFDFDLRSPFGGQQRGFLILEMYFFSLSPGDGFHLFIAFIVCANMLYEI